MATILIPTSSAPSTATATPGAMSRLELVRRVYLEAGLAGNGPTSTTGQTGEAAQIVGYIDEAWLKVQQRAYWRWMWELVSLTLEDGEQTITSESVPADRYVRTSAMIGQGSLAYTDWDVWRAMHPSITSAGIPSEWTVRPDNVLQFDCIASGDQAIQVERYRNPSVMTADDDEPVGLKGEHHMAIVWEAVLLYAGFDEASNLYAHAKAMRKRAYQAMHRNEGAMMMSLGAPLA